METCTARHWTFGEPCRRTQPHPGYHVGDRRIWSDEHCSEDLIARIDDLAEALDDAENTIREMEVAADDLAEMVSAQSRKIVRLSERTA